MKTRVFSTMFAAVALSLTAGDWTRFRGTDGQGRAEDQKLPAQWSAQRNLVWRVALPGYGSSSPIVLGDRIYLTCYSGYGLNPGSPGNQSRLTRSIVCLDKKSGETVWKQPVPSGPPGSRYQGRLTDHGYASSTLATDGDRIYAFFGISGVMAFKLNGDFLWQTKVGNGTHGWGSATSPVLFEDLVIVNASVESKSLIGLEKATGKVRWRAGGMIAAWNTPLVMESPAGKPELVVNVRGKLLGFDPASGKALWNCQGIDDYICPSVVGHNGVAYAIGGRPRDGLAVKLGGRGNVTDTHLLWRTSSGSNVPSPVFHNGYLYWVNDRGIATCLDTKTGETVYEQRVRSATGRGSSVYASTLIADNKVYAVTRHGGTFVLAAKPEFELLAHNRFEDDNTTFNASPLAVDNRLYLRSDEYLYCIGQTGSASE